MAGGDSLGGESEEGACVRSRQWAGLAQARRSEEDWRVREDIGLLLRRGGGEGKTGLRGGKGSDDHEVSIPRVGDGDRAGRRPSNVSTMIMRPPQHGHWLAGVLVSLSASALDVVGANRGGEQAVVVASRRGLQPR